MAQPSDRSDRLEVTTRVNAPSSRIFELITDPATHVAIDSSEMLLGVDDSTPVAAVGDSFVVHMDREPLGDLPLGKYDVENTITVFDTGRQLERAPGAPGDKPLGHAYGYLLEAVDDSSTEVTSYSDWSSIDDGVRNFLTFPVISEDALDATLSRLADLAEGS
jgi:hypothetical protein